jgi:hypothetical protein
VSTGHYVGIAVPFTVEEFGRLATMAAAQGASIADIIRERVFGSLECTTETLAVDDDDLTTMIARIEGIRIRSRGRRGD